MIKPSVKPVDQAVVLGIDVGTSGVRVAALSVTGTLLASAACRFAELGDDHQSPDLWWQAVGDSLAAVLHQVQPHRVAAVCVDGTSGTLLPITRDGQPLAAPLMYNDSVPDAALADCIARHMPPTSAAGGVTSGLAKALHFQALQPELIVHQADWIAGQLSGVHGISDANNALKTGYDPISNCWPAWIEKTGMRIGLLPDVRIPGGLSVPLAPSVCARFNLPASVALVAGTTDGCASFLATGASQPGEAVTALGSTMTLKMLSTKPLFAPEFGLYSHRIGNIWLAGGASNTGGKVLASFFDEATLVALSAAIDTTATTGLNYYPLLAPGERFPINDAELQPGLMPRPDDDMTFLQGMLEGMARIEALGYQRLADMGAPRLCSVRTVGGGAANQAWAELRRRELGVELLPAESEQAAVGAARLALRGLDPQQGFG